MDAWKRLTWFFLCLVFIACAAGCLAEAFDSGDDGNIHWEISRSSEEYFGYALTVTGSGDMRDYDPPNDCCPGTVHAPWILDFVKQGSPYGRNFNQITIGEGITRIGRYAFCIMQGQYMGTVNKTETSPLDLTKRMIGREVFLNIEKDYGKAGEKILDVQDVWVSSHKETSKIRGMSLCVHAGEIVGVAGIDGNGQSELIEAITGLRRVEKGKVIVCGQDVTNKSVRKIREAGLSHIPEDRNKMGLDRAMTIRDNLVAVQVEKAPFSRGGLMSIPDQDKYSERMVKEFDIRPTDYHLPTSSLSGGNAQKVVVAREVSIGNKLLIASQPTRGVDIGAIELIRNTIEKAKKTGMGVLLVSAELEEIISLSDRIIVIHEGKITGEMMASEANENNLGLLMMGGHVEEGGAQTT